jgi:hypothetical protein
MHIWIIKEKKKRNWGLKDLIDKSKLI